MFSKFLDLNHDVAFFKIFGCEQHEPILIHFNNGILSFQQEQKIEVEFLKSIQDLEIAFKKQSITNVLCRDAKGVQYIIEMQVVKTKLSEQWAQYYAAKAYGRQTNRCDNYCYLKEVTFIAMTDCILFPEKNRL
jgi:predicted transposase/invertase (TIGR01784 family)